MSALLVIVLPIVASLAGVALSHLSLRCFPPYKRGTVVGFDGDCTGIYVRRSSWGGYHRVIATGPDWYSAARERREITVHASRDRLTAA